MKILVAAAAFLAAAGLSTLPAGARQLDVVASFSVLGDMVAEVGGDDVRVHTLIGPGGDPHVYEPTPQDAQALSHADLVIVNGLGLEGFLDRLVAASGYKGRIVVVSDGIITREMEEDGETVTDPHAWNSAANGVIYAANIRAALSEADPAHAAGYAERGRAYEAELQALDAWAREQVATVPPAQRKVITSHDAFGYLGEAYGIELLAPLGLSTEAEASAADVAKLIDQIKAEKIKAVFIENSNDPRLVQQIAAETGLTPGGTLYAESLSAADGPAPTYARLFHYNIETLVTGMKGE